ncbi:MAG TPA: N-acetyltransferase family protein [Candidatus Limiplasma sp.]|nr:N-acetyltransferase family protein [Candidatus Limiplasma sp.]
MEYRITDMQPTDWDQVASIYSEGIQTGIATFQAEVPVWEKWNQSHSQSCRLVAVSEAGVLGWAALTPVSDRCVYAGVADVSIYIGQRYRGQGVGQALMTELIRRSEQEGFWMLQSRIILENAASQALHAKCGFRKVGVREKLGKMKQGSWHDVVVMERRSRTVGVN